MPTWTADTDRSLLLAVIVALSPSPPNWETVVSHMGPGYTKEAVRQRYAKLKKLANGEVVGAPEKPEATAEPSKAFKKLKDGINGTKKRSKVKMQDEVDDENAPKRVKVKAENVDDD